MNKLKHKRLEVTSILDQLRNCKLSPVTIMEQVVQRSDEAHKKQAGYFIAQDYQKLLE